MKTDNFYHRDITVTVMKTEDFYYRDWFNVTINKNGQFLS